MEWLAWALLQQAESVALSFRVICRVPIRLIAYANLQLKSTLNPMLYQATRQLLCATF